MLCNTIQTNQTTLQYVTTNDSQVMEFSHLPPDHSEIFLPIEPPTTTPTSSSLNGNGVVFKRRPSDTIIDHHNGGAEWPDYLYPPAKRHHPHPSHLSSSVSVGGRDGTGAGPTNYSTQPSVYDYPSSVVNRGDSDPGGFSVLLDKVNIYRRTYIYKTKINRIFMQMRFILFFILLSNYLLQREKTFC